MNIEVGHKPLELHSRVLLSVNNPRLAEERLGRFCDAKLDRGYRLRIIPDYQAKTLELGSRKDLNVRMALRVLSDGGFNPRRIPWRDNPILWKIKHKDYK